jgi:peptidylprolyl isomerase
LHRFRTCTRTLLCLAAVGIGLTACGNHANSAGGGGHDTAGGGGHSQWPASAAGTWGKQPSITYPASSPPTKLVSYNLINGTGATAKLGDTISVQYVGATYSLKKVFQASWDSGGPASFPLTVGGLIEGWTDGIPGMKVGGRRELIIPPSLGYGSSPPSGSGIPAGATLIFIVDLLSVSS